MSDKCLVAAGVLGESNSKRAIESKPTKTTIFVTDWGYTTARQRRNQ